MQTQTVLCSETSRAIFKHWTWINNFGQLEILGQAKIQRKPANREIFWRTGRKQTIIKHKEARKNTQRTDHKRSLINDWPYLLFSPTFSDERILRKTLEEQSKKVSSLLSIPQLSVSYRIFANPGMPFLEIVNKNSGLCACWWWNSALCRHFALPCWPSLLRIFVKEAE